MKIRYIILTISFLCLHFLKVHGQITDSRNVAKDTTQNADTTHVQIKYGAKTTIYFYEQEIYSHQYDTNYVDTLLHNIHRYNFLHKNGNRYQNLGGMGTATSPIYYQFPQKIGTKLGYKAFAPYLVQPSRMKYFNTMSPYTEIDFAQGGAGRTHLKVTFSQNINPDLNFALRYQKLQQNEVFVNSVRKNTTWASNEVFAANLSWWSRSHRYKLLTNITHYEHITNDFGGYQVDDTIKDIKKLFEVENNAQLAFQIDNGVGALQTQKQWHLYHQYALLDSSTVQIFHVLDRISRMNKQQDESFKVHKLYDTLYFNVNALKKNKVNYQQYYHIFQNKLGIKGQLSRLYYWAYAQLKQYQLKTKYIHPEYASDTTRTDQIEDEIFAGAMLGVDLSRLSKLAARAKYLLNKHNDYQVDVHFKNKLLNIRYQNSSYSPTILQNRFYGGFFRWGDSLSITKNTHAQRYSASLNLDFSSVQLSPSVSYTNLRDYVYFDSSAHPQQYGANIQIIQLGLNTNFHWKNIRSDLQLLYTINDQHPIRTPKFQITGKIYRDGKLFRSKRNTQIGIDFHYKTAYYANNFMPATQQFYLQNKFKVENYLNIDLFFNLQIKAFLLFVKINNLTQNLIGQGYYTTPVYFAQPRGFEVGVKWRFFD